MNKLKQQLKNGQLSQGAWLQIGHSASAEILASAGFDWVCIDLEHAAIDMAQVATLFTAIERHNCVHLARVPENSTI